MAITDPCVIRLAVEGGAIEVFGHKETDGSWSFVGRGTNLDIEEENEENGSVGGIPRCRDLAEVLPSQWIIFFPWKVHPELREWFRQRYDAAVAALPAHRRESHSEYCHHKWQSLFNSTPPDRWSEPDEF